MPRKAQSRQFRPRSKYKLAQKAASALQSRPPDHVPDPQPISVSPRETDHLREVHHDPNPEILEKVTDLEIAIGALSAAEITPSVLVVQLPQLPVGMATSRNVQHDHNYCGVESTEAANRTTLSSLDPINVEDGTAKSLEVIVEIPSSSPSPFNVENEQEVDRNFLMASQKLRKTLPVLWIPIVTPEGLNVFKISDTQARVTQRSILISKTGELAYYVHGNLLPRTHSVYSDSESSVDVSSVEKITSASISCVSVFRKFEICCGVTSEKFKPFWRNCDKTIIDNNPFKELRYRETLRGDKCAIVVSGSDRQGRSRGHCTARNCDCIIYAYNESTPADNECTHCKCLPKFHIIPGELELIIVDVKTAEPVSVSGEVNVECYLSELMASNSVDQDQVSTKGSKPPAWSDDVFCSSGSLDSDSCDSPPMKRKKPTSHQSQDTKIRGGPSHRSSVPHDNNELSTEKPSSAKKDSLQYLKETLSKEALYAICVPECLPGDAEERIKKLGKMTSTDRQYVFRWMSGAMAQMGLVSDDDYFNIATRAVQAHPLLQFKHNNGVEGIVKSLKEVKRNRAYYADKKAKENHVKAEKSSLEQRALKKVKKKMDNEMARRPPNIQNLKDLLQANRGLRLKFVKSQSYKEHLNHFACLEKPELVQWEFFKQERLLATQKEDLEMKWINAIPCMVEYFSTYQSNISRTLPTDIATKEILTHMNSVSFFGARVLKQNRKRNSYVLEVFPEGTPRSSTTPDLKDPPRMIAVGSSSSDNLQAEVSVGGLVAFTGPVVSALVHIVAMYYVFGIQASKEARSSFAFLFGFFLDTGAQTEVKKYKSVMKALDSITTPQKL